MATKLHLISELSENTVRTLSNIDNWTAFLRSAAWQYKYPFEDQVLIFAQRPDATACADFETWNEKIHRRIKRGAKGIALMREQGDRYFLDYVFDVSDTYEPVRNTNLPLWKYNEKYDDVLIETLENTFGELKVTTTMTDAVISASHNAAQDNKSDYLSELKYAKGNSFLEDLDELNIDSEFQSILSNSVAYMIMSRLGLQPDYIFEREDFRNIVDFNTPETITILGNAVSGICEQALREISQTIRAEIIKGKEQTKIFANPKNSGYNENTQNKFNTTDERNDNDDGGNLQDRKRDSDTELDSTAERSDDRQIRTNEENISQTEPQEPVFSDDDKRDAPLSPVGDRQDGEGTDRTDDTENGESGGRERADESGKPDEVDGTYEQLPPFRRRSSNQTISSQLSLFDVIDEVNIQDDMQREAARLAGAAFSMPQEIIDVVLADGGNRNNSKLRICTQYQKQKPLNENVEFLKNEYKKGGKGFIVGDRQVSVWFDEKGINIQYGKENTENGYLLSWEDAAKRIGELLDMGQYMPQIEIAQAGFNEKDEIAKRLWVIFRDSGNRDLLEEMKQGGGAPDEEARIAKSLSDPQRRDEIAEILNNLLSNPEEYEKIPTYYSESPMQTAKLLDELSIPRKIYTANEAVPFSGTRFITQNEIDSALTRGSGIESGKMRIFSYFLRETDSKQRADFLKNEYGTGGGTGAINGEGYEDHDAKGLRLKRGGISNPYDTVTLSWPQVAKRIDYLIKAGRYANEHDIADIPKYEKKEIATQIFHSFSSISEDKYSPYPKGFDYYNAIPVIAEKLADKEKTAEMLAELQALLMETPKDDRDYKIREHCAKVLESYVNGTYNLFPGIERPSENYLSELERAKELIREYHLEEFGSNDSDFSNLKDVGLAYTETEDGVHTIQVSVNLVDFSISRYVDDKEIEKRVYSSLENLITDELEGMSFDDLVYLSPEQLAELENEKTEKTIAEQLEEYHSDDDGKAVVLFPVGDFYECYGADAENAAAVLDLHLTHKELDGEIYAMCGFPRHIMEKYINTLNDNGYDAVIIGDDKKPYRIISTEKALSYNEQDEIIEENFDNEYSDDELASIYGGDTKDSQRQIAEDMATAVQPQITHPIYENRNYNFIEKIAPEILDGTSGYIRFQAGPSFMPLVIERLNDNTISLTHYYIQNGDNMYDPDMRFTFDSNARTLSARSFQQDMPPIYQEAELDDGSINTKLKNELNSFAVGWFKNISDQRYVRERMIVPYHEDEIEIQYNKNGDIIAVDGEPELVESYIKENDIHIVTEKQYDIGFGSLGNGTTVWNRLEEVDNDYKTIAHIDDNGEITFYEDLPDAVKNRIEEYTKANVLKEEQPIIPEFEKEKPARVANTILYPEIPMPERKNFVITDDELGYGGAKEKFRKNMEAIRVLKECEADHRLATPEEQEILSQYVGWGGLADAFDETKSNWADEFKELYTALTPEEYEQARASTLNAHYTSPVIIKAMYKALGNMEFTQGNILEPSCGIGNFMGLVPESMKDSKIYGIEIDSITGRIAQQLYQRNSVAIQGFEDTTLPDSFFDVAIGNVPFGDYKLNDKKYNKHNFLIHDYFFAKTLDKVRPGGIVAFITSSGTMDKRNSKVRQYIAQRADLVGAIRLPNNAFLKNAGTEVTADILFLQKRDRMTDIMPEWVNLGTLENGITANQYFVDNPDMILGEMTTVSGPFGATDVCKPYEDSDLSELLDGAVQNINATITEYEIDDISNDENMSIPADPDVKNFSFTVVGGDIYFRENSIMRKVELNATAENRIKGMIGIRDCVRDLIEYQTEGYADYEIKAQQEKLNTLYDEFTKKYGLINSRGNAMAFSDDSSYFLLCSLEIINENGELERKADMFTKRTIGAKNIVDKVDTASEALAVSLGEKAKIDMEFMSELTGKTEEELYGDLTGVIFLNPMYDENNHYSEKYFTADEYLSGNVRHKLAEAKLAAANDDSFNINVAALTEIQPIDLTASEITVRLGTTWIPPEYIKEFVYELLSPNWYARNRIDVLYSGITGEWNITNKSYDKGVKATNTYGTHRINAYKIIEETLNLKDVRIFDYVENENGSKVAVLNKKETTIAQQKQDLIKSEFDNWIWKDPDRREKLTKLYNERFNSVRPREYDGSHVTFSGMNPEIILRKHQQDAVARIMYGGNSLLGHVVGAGKTWTMVAAAMEMKRLGLCNKSLFVVPNHLTEQWASEFLQLYPAANILVATKKDFETKNRKKFCGRIATGDYDAVIIGHSQFEKIPMSQERQRAILERQLDEIINGIIEAKAHNAERYTVKQMEKSKRSIEAKLDKLNDQSRKDDVVTFEELGVDRVFIDEAHFYKNLYLYTKMRNVGGIAQTEAQKSSDLFMKTQYLDEITGGKGVIFATGTPVSNSMVELYTMQRYLQYNTLKENNLQHFDAWASTFGETITAIELAPEGTGYRAKTRFAKFFNLPELMAMFKEVADIQTADMLNLPTPTPHYQTIAVQPTEIQKDMVKELAERAEKVRNKMVDPSVDNMLKITNDGRKLALDQRLINPMLPDDENSKVSSCANEVLKIWEETKDIKGTQLVFCDLSTPKNDGEFNVYSDIRDKLIAGGVPESEIEFIHNADSEVKKKELFSRVRKGDVRILLGSTAKMGAGTNVQRLLYASHDLDCPWRPADLEQRAGRIIRQGNLNDDVQIRRYVTKDTFDSYMWQLVENKQKFISQIMTSKSPVRSAEDIDETALSYAEIKALATGNPHIKEKMDLDTQVAKLKLIKSSFMSQKYELEDKVIKEYPQKITMLTERIEGFKSDIEVVSQYPKKEDKFYPLTIDGLVYYEKDQAGKALIERFGKMTSPEPVNIGDYRGFSMELSFDTFNKLFYVTLKGKLSHKTEMGGDVFGNIQRLDNTLEGFQKRLEATEENLNDTKKEFEIAKVESKKEFPQEAELQEKLARLAEVDALLNMDKKDHEGADLGEPDEQEILKKSKNEPER